MEVEFDLPSGDRVWVVDTATAAQYLGAMLQRFQNGEQEPLFYGDEPRPQGVVISFEQWSEYEALRVEAEFDKRMEQITRERLANAKPGDWVSFEDAVREGGWDLDVESEDDPGDAGPPARRS